jgi:hypothetical protein
MSWSAIAVHIVCKWPLKRSGFSQHGGVTSSQRLANDIFLSLRRSVTVFSAWVKRTALRPRSRDIVKYECLGGNRQWVRDLGFLEYELLVRKCPEVMLVIFSLEAHAGRKSDSTSAIQRRLFCHSRGFSSKYFAPETPISTAAQEQRENKPISSSTAPRQESGSRRPWGLSTPRDCSAWRAEAPATIVVPHRDLTSSPMIDVGAALASSYSSSAGIRYISPLHALYMDGNSCRILTL